MAREVYGGNEVEKDKPKEGRVWWGVCGASRQRDLRPLPPAAPGYGSYLVRGVGDEIRRRNDRTRGQSQALILLGRAPMLPQTRPFYTHFCEESRAEMEALCPTDLPCSSRD